MLRTIQIRNVPEELHRKLEARAAAAGMALSDYLLAELAGAGEGPTGAELLARLAERSPVQPKTSSAAAVRAERDSQ